MFYRMLVGLSALAMLMGFGGCGGSSSSTDTAAQESSGVGTLSVLMTDAPGEYKAVYVTVSEVWVHRADDGSEDTNTTEVEDDNATVGDDSNTTNEEGNVSEDSNTSGDANATAPMQASAADDESGWIVVAEPNTTYDLLTLQGGVTALLGEANLSAGKYTQVRMILGDSDDNGTNMLGTPHPYPHYVIYVGDDTGELKVASNTIKLNHPFDVVSGETVELTLDFDANQSVHEAGNSGQVILTPVITAKSALKKGTADEEDTGGDEPVFSDANVTE